MSTRVSPKGKTQYSQVRDVKVAYSTHLTEDTIDTTYVHKPEGQYVVQVLMTEEQKDFMVNTTGVPEMVNHNVMFRKDEATGLYRYKFHNPVQWGPPPIFWVEKTMDAARNAEDTAWWNHMVPYEEAVDGLIKEGSVLDVHYSVYTPNDKPNKAIRISKIGIKSLALEMAA